MVSKYKYLGAICVLSAAIFCLFLRPYAEIFAGEKPLKAHFAKVTRVIDGDTIEIEGGEKVRYIGVDTPELHHPNKPVQHFAEEAYKYNRDLVVGKDVYLVFDVQRRDRYGRLLAYVFVEDSFINAKLVKDGYARVATYPPNVIYQELFLNLEQQARNANRGLWGKQ